MIFLLLLWQLPQWQSNAYRAKFTPAEIEKFTAPEKILIEKNAADIENSTRLTLAQIIGGLALLSGLWLTYENVKAAQSNARTAQENLRVTEEGKITDRFSKAVELLGNEKLDIRLGGIYALERIARDSQKDHWTVMEVLTAFVRENAPYNPGEHEDFELEDNHDEDDHSEEQTIPKPREDIQAIMTVIGRREGNETETQRLNLQRVNLARCVLVNANLNKANFGQANLSRAILVRANLSETYLRGANLNKANLIEADLSKANLIEADLSKANLTGVNLSGANLIGTVLFRADLGKADLTLTKFITLEQILSAQYFEITKLPPKLEREFEEWLAKQAKENQSADKISADDEKKS